MSRSGSRISVGDAVDLEQKGNKQVLKEILFIQPRCVPQGCILAPLLLQSLALYYFSS